jgi:hypothetical protein
MSTATTATVPTTRRSTTFGIGDVGYQHQTNCKYSNKFFHVNLSI